MDRGTWPDGTAVSTSVA